MENKSSAIAVLGTGMVGKTIASRLAQQGHAVTLGSRSPEGAAADWARASGPHASAATFADAVQSSAVVFNCTNGENSLAALRLAGKKALAGKILIDVANPLSHANPGTLTVCNTDSLGEQIQREFPETRVVKALNTMNCSVMVDPARVPGEHCAFMAGNDADAKRQVAAALGRWFGWPSERMVDLGAIDAARGMEMYLPLWISLWKKVGHADFNLQVDRARAV